jgi:Protein of unknown function (DUF3300)
MRKMIIAIAATLLVASDPAGSSAVKVAVVQSAPPTSSAKTAQHQTSAEALDKLLAPIALYPDQLLAQMLLCASNPGKLAALNEWLASHATEKGSALQDAATKAGFDPSFVALVLFPDVVSTMAGRLDWTRQLGEAFAADRSAVFGSIQRLRAQAQKAGTLKDTPQQDVETKTTSSGQQVIVIEPANPQVVYVPQYNPQVVYTQPTSSTVVVQSGSSSSGDAVAAGLIGFTAGIAIGAAMDNDYYYGPYGWGRGGAYMYNDAWDDWYDAREDARDDWTDHREDIVEERGERAENAQGQRTERAETAQQQRTERTESRQQNRPESQAQREQRRTNAQAASGSTAAGTSAASTSGAASKARATAESRGYSGTERTKPERSGTSSDAFSGYSSGKSTRASSERGQRSRSSSRGSRSRR